MTIFRVVVHDMTVWIAIILDTGRKLLIFPMLTKEESLVYVSHPTTVLHPCGKEGKWRIPPLLGFQSTLRTPMTKIVFKIMTGPPVARADSLPLGAVTYTSTGTLPMPKKCREI